MKTNLFSKILIAVAIALSFSFTTHISDRPEDMVYYIYAQSFSAKNKASYFTNVFAIHVGEDGDDAYILSATANAAIRKLENEFGNHLYAELDYGQVSTTGFYFLTKGEAITGRSNAMALEKSKGNSVSGVSLFEFEFDKDE